jgi:hypothetical protein
MPMREPRRGRHPLVAILALVAVVAASCSGDSDSPDVDVAGSDPAGGGLAAQVAGFDLVAGRSGRFLVGVFSVDRERGLAYDRIDISFEHVDEAGGKSKSAIPPTDTTAEFLPIPGQPAARSESGPALVPGSETIGVYRARDVQFDEPGFWQATITAEVDGTTQRATAAFEVAAKSEIPAPGDRAPATRQPLAGDPATDPDAIDSRAAADGTVPDPELHDITVADAIAAGTPTVVVVSTPTYCQSRFCGPITDSVADLAARYRGQASFIHLEVWADFDNQQLNPAVREWILPTGSEEGNEPWVFVVGRDGIIAERFDNVAGEEELEQSLQRAIAG